MLEMDIQASNPLFEHIPSSNKTSCGFYAQKRGKYNRRFRLRFFTYDLHAKKLIYWTNKTEALQTELGISYTDSVSPLVRSKPPRCRGVIAVKRMYTYGIKQRSNEAVEPNIRRFRAVDRKYQVSSSTRITRNNLCERSSKACSEIYIEDQNGRTFHLRNVQRADMDKLLHDFAGVSWDVETPQRRYYSNLRSDPNLASLVL
jgi:hypothetical protein